MGKLKKFSIILSSLLLAVICGFGVFEWLKNGIISLNAIFAGCLSLAFLFNSLTWGDMQGDHAKDELDMHIKTQSAKIGYFILMILSLIILVISEGVGVVNNFNEIKNLPLALVVCLAFTVLPITEYLYAKKYK
ncbi:DUF2178 domain-containing protein [Metabacillus malikii]|uniref:Magnesium-transporting ATPase (P-type) n=1 Tax=Metabacillus malikii TaxID=1504265 RepID=A0ABT9ZK17_9BACI|nr:DUF2178 domain-containing protein [Metabacillus malikii]MDQ0232633.1 magnesium-transporting ATPase (P-type) [Metabacillus malikii]